MQTEEKEGWRNREEEEEEGVRKPIIPVYLNKITSCDCVNHLCTSQYLEF